MVGKALDRLQEPDTKIQRFRPPGARSSFSRGFNYVERQPDPMPCGNGIAATTLHS